MTESGSRGDLKTSTSFCASGRASAPRVVKEVVGLGTGLGVGLAGDSLLRSNHSCPEERRASPGRDNFFEIFFGGWAGRNGNAGGPPTCASPRRGGREIFSPPLACGRAATCDGRTPPPARGWSPPAAAPSARGFRRNFKCLLVCAHAATGDRSRAATEEGRTPMPARALGRHPAQTSCAGHSRAGRPRSRLR